MELGSENQCSPINILSPSLRCCEKTQAVASTSRENEKGWGENAGLLPVCFYGDQITETGIQMKAKAGHSWIGRAYLCRVERLESAAPALLMNWMGLGDCSPGLPFPLVLAPISPSSGSEVVEDSWSKICKGINK